MRRFLSLVAAWLLLASAVSGQIIQRSAIDLIKGDSSTVTTTKDYYHLALTYKNGDGVPINYAKAFDNFQKAADLGDAQSSYAVAYMHYKGLGCPQNYQLAAALFARGAYAGRDNSMYFLGLCFRNGYGLDRNEDSATYWLNKSAATGYVQAKQELLAKAGENANDSAGALVQKIHNAALPPKTVLNEFRQLTPHIPSKELIAGEYTGYLLQYDWSGAHIISNKALHFSLKAAENTADNNTATLTGAWTEKGATPVTLKASLRQDSLVFQDSRYSLKDHYSEERAIDYDFTSASLNLTRSGDSVYLAGSVAMFSPVRNEPSKPTFIALVRKQTADLNAKDTLQDKWTKKDKKDSSQTALQEMTDVKVYPNPFVSAVTVAFSVHGSVEVAVQLLDMGGALVYKKPQQLLQTGRYAITLSPGRIASGVYILRLMHGSEVTNIKVIHK